MIDWVKMGICKQLLWLQHVWSIVVDASLSLTDVNVRDIALAQFGKHIRMIDALVSNFCR
jgi:hypothetical protein